MTRREYQNTFVLGAVHLWSTLYVPTSGTPVVYDMHGLGTRLLQGASKSHIGL